MPLGLAFMFCAAVGLGAALGMCVTIHFPFDP